MSNFSIETAQNISIKQNVAPVSTRIGAFIIDYLIIFLYILAVIFITGLLGLENKSVQIVTYVLLSLPAFLYSLLLETLLNGQTAGKILLGIKVTKIDGSKPTFGSYLIRWILRPIDLFLGSGSVALLTILLNGKGQRLGDIAAKTTVITEKKQISIKQTLMVDVAENYQPTFPQVTVLNDRDIQTIKNLYNDALKKGNHNTIVKLHAKVIDLTGIVTNLKPIEFLNIVIKDYNYYTQQM